MSFDAGRRRLFSPTPTSEGGSDSEFEAQISPKNPSPDDSHQLREELSEQNENPPGIPATNWDFTRSIVTGARDFSAREAQEVIQEGTVLFGRYLVLKALGRGGMGQVWKVRHIDLDTIRALKMLFNFSGSEDHSPEMKYRFRREARTMASFSHPHSITIHDARFANEMTFIDMEFVAGRTLSALLNESWQHLDFTTRILEQLCDVLQAAHDRGIIHRDIKPANIMLLDGFPAGREFIKLLDFGLAIVAGDDTYERAGMLVGTPYYMSPEQIQGVGIDHRSDIYSLGVMIYEILTGRRPFEGSLDKVMFAHMSNIPGSLRIARPEAKIPEKIDELVLSCMAKDPADRPRSAREVAERFVWSLPPRFKHVFPVGRRAENQTHLRPPPGYVLANRLGSGGFGEVWEATDEDGVRVALKYVRLDEEHIAQAEWNAQQIIKNVRHPNLLVPFKSWQSTDHLILGMELADGTLMQKFTEARERGEVGLARDVTLELLREAARGLDYLNSRSHTLDKQSRGGIYHCDIKPQNILLMGGAVKVADFGVAKFTTNSLTDRDAASTVLYAAPEFLKKKAARQSDQYSLAIVYCQVRGGRLPFNGATAEIISGHLSSPPDLSMLPSEERPVVLRALSKEPRGRFASCSAFVDALASVRNNPGPTLSWWKRLLNRLRPLGPGRFRWSGETTEPATPSGIPGDDVHIPTTRSRPYDPPDPKPKKVGDDFT